MACLRTAPQPIPGSTATRAADDGAEQRFGHGFDSAFDLMPNVNGSGAALGDLEPLVVAERRGAVLHVQIGVTHPAARNPHQRFAAARLQKVHDGLASVAP